MIKSVSMNRQSANWSWKRNFLSPMVQLT